MPSNLTALPSVGVFKTGSASSGVITRLESISLTQQSILGTLTLLSSNNVWSRKKVIRQVRYVGIVRVNVSNFFQRRNRSFRQGGYKSFQGEPPVFRRCRFSFSLFES